MFDPIEIDEVGSQDMETILNGLLLPAIKVIGETLHGADDKLRFDASKLLIQLYMKTSKASEDVVSRELNESFKALNSKLEGKG